MKKNPFSFALLAATSLLLCLAVSCDEGNDNDDGPGDDIIPTVETPFDGDARILYYDQATQTLKVGYNPAQDKMMFFKFGSVVGFYNDGGAWASSKIAYNPTTGSYSDYISIPYTSTNTSVSHTYTNVQAGKGDPCRLVGIKASEISSSNYDNETWRMPTRNENINFVGAPTSWYGSSSPIISLSNRSAAYWGENEGRGGGWFPIPGDRESTTGRTTRSNNSAGFLPAAGARALNNGTSVDIGSKGFYWSNSSYDANHAFQIFFDNSSIFPDFWSGGAGVIEKNSGMAIRCVPQ